MKKIQIESFFSRYIFGIDNLGENERQKIDWEQYYLENNLIPCCLNHVFNVIAEILKDDKVKEVYQNLRECADTDDRSVLFALVKYYKISFIDLDDKIVYDQCNSDNDLCLFIIYK